MRRNSWVPNSPSSGAIGLLIAGWPMPSSFAAAREAATLQGAHEGAGGQSIRSMKYSKLGINYIPSYSIACKPARR